MSLRVWIASAILLAATIGFVVLLIRYWAERALRLRLLGNLFLISIVPASLLVSHDDVVATILVGGGLLGVGFTLRVLAERAERASGAA